MVGLLVKFWNGGAIQLIFLSCDGEAKLRYDGYPSVGEVYLRVGLDARCAGIRVIDYRRGEGFLVENCHGIPFSKGVCETNVTNGLHEV